VKIAINRLTSFTSGSITKLNDIFWKPLWKILTFNPSNDVISAQKSLTASLEKGTLSLAYGSRFLSRIKIKGVREYSFEEGKYPQPEGLASSLILATKELGAAGADVSLSIPKAWVIIKTVEFPVTVKENLPDVIVYELDRITPFNSENAFYDYTVLSESDSKLSVLIMASKADLVKPYIESLSEIGLTVRRLTVNLSSIGTLCHYIDKGKDFIYMQIDTNKYEGASFFGGSINTPFAGSFTSADEKSKADTVIKEIGSLITTQNSGKLADTMIHLKDKSPTLKELLKVQLPLPVKILNETDIKLRTSGTHEEIPYAAIGGVLESLWPKSKSLNLLKKGHHEIQTTPFALTVILTLLIIAMFVLYMIAPLKLEGKKLQEIDSQIALRKEEVKKVEMLKKEINELNNEISTINNFKGKSPMALDIIKELTVILPKDTWLTRVMIKESTVNIEGYARSASTLLQKLEISKYFKKAEFSSPTFRDTRMNSDRFNIKVEIEGIKKDDGEVLKK
jgi:Tfp pilus assembly protein PilN